MNKSTERTFYVLRCEKSTVRNLAKSEDSAEEPLKGELSPQRHIGHLPVCSCSGLYVIGSAGLLQLLLPFPSAGNGTLTHAKQELCY